MRVTPGSTASLPKSLNAQALNSEQTPKRYAPKPYCKFCTAKPNQSTRLGPRHAKSSVSPETLKALNAVQPLDPASSLINRQNPETPEPYNPQTRPHHSSWCSGPTRGNAFYGGAAGRSIPKTTRTWRQRSNSGPLWRQKRKGEGRKSIP